MYRTKIEEFLEIVNLGNTLLGGLLRLKIKTERFLCRVIKCRQDRRNYTWWKIKHGLVEWQRPRPNGQSQNNDGTNAFLE